MSGWEILGLLLLLGLVWLWFDTLNARESGLRAVRAACQSHGVQLLDDTVSLILLRPARNSRGHLVLRRVYGFEFSDTGNNRHPGAVVLLGQRVLMLDLGAHGANYEASQEH